MTDGGTFYHKNPGTNDTPESASKVVAVHEEAGICYPKVVLRPEEFDRLVQAITQSILDKYHSELERFRADPRRF